jgi:hypothetical protein
VSVSTKKQLTLARKTDLRMQHKDHVSEVAYSATASMPFCTRFDNK